MVLEVAVLDVIPDKSNEFLQAFSQAAPLLASMDGYIDHDLKTCIEEPSRFLLLVN